MAEPYTPDLTYSNVMQALRNAHEAGDEAAAKRLATIANKLRSEPGLEPDMGTLEAMQRGYGSEIADIVGLPTDIVNVGAKAVGELTGIPLGVEKPFMGSQYLREKGEPYGLTYTDPRSIPEAMRPSTRFGRVLGGGQLFMIPGLTAMRAKEAKGLFAPIIEAAKQAPGRFAAIEALTTTGAATAGAIQEYLDPGAPWYGQMLAEMAGGVLTPGHFLLRTSRNLQTGAANLWRKFLPSGRQEASKEAILRELETWGEDFDTVFKRVLETPELLQQLPTAYRAMSPTLIGLTQKYMREMPDLEESVKKQIQKTIKILNGAARVAIESGNKDALRQVASARRMWFLTMLNARISNVEQTAARTVERIRPDEAISRGSTRVRNTLEDSLDDARAFERDVWSEIPDDIELDAVNIENTMPAYQAARQQILEEQSLPAPVEAVLRRFDRFLQQQQPEAPGPADVGGTLGAEAEAFMAARRAEEAGEELVEEAPEIITSGDLKNLRSQALRAQRMLRGAGAGKTPDWNMIRLLGDIADAVLEDLANVPSISEDALTEARQVSIQLNNLFSRGIVPELMGFKPSGGVRVEPESTLIAGLPSGREGVKAAVSSKQIENAARLQGLERETLTRRTTMREQEDFIRHLANDPNIVDPKTLRVNEKALRSFRERNKELLNRFPELRSALRDASTAESLLKKRQKDVDKIRTKFEQKSIISQLLNAEDPTVVVGQILKGKNPIQEYTELARLAKRAGPDGLAGLRAATFDYIFDKALVGDLLSSKEAMDLLYTKPNPNMPSIKDIMVSEGVLEASQITRLSIVLKSIRSLEKSLTMGHNIDEVLDNPSLLEDLVARLIGSNLAGSSMVAQNTGSSLLMAHAGSRWAREWLNKIPIARTKEIIKEALESPAFFMGLMTKDPSAAARRNLERQLEAFLWQTMFISDFPEDTPEEPPVERITQPGHFPLNIPGMTSPPVKHKGGLIQKPFNLTEYLEM